MRIATLGLLIVTALPLEAGAQQGDVPKRKTEVFQVDGRWIPVAAVDDPELLREAMAFYSAASFVFRHGLYRDEEQTPPEQRAALVRIRHGSN